MESSSTGTHSWWKDNPEIPGRARRILEYLNEKGLYEAKPSKRMLVGNFFDNPSGYYTQSFCIIIPSVDIEFYRKVVRLGVRQVLRQYGGTITRFLFRASSDGTIAVVWQIE